MPLISNISIQQNPQAKKAFSKVNFEAGEKFNARIVSIDTQKGEVNLKLLDGWQFSAKVDKSLEKIISGGVLKFVVEGFEDNKLKIKLLYEYKEGEIAQNNLLEEFTSEKSLSIDKTDALLFEKMIKHDMPLTKDNIASIKNLVDFREKISLNPDKEEIFIAKYLDSRNIDLDSEKANEITKTLKSFFEVLKNLDVDEILLFKENNIELTKGNLESFIKLFKGQSALYNNLKDANNCILNSDTTKVELQYSTKEATDILIKEQIKLKTDEIKNIVKVFIENKLNLKPEAYAKVMNIFNEKLNDIKIFNSISEQYYYFDLPINVKENEYQCKLIIKDDRKKGKKIDSKNVKIATRVKTINMGTVDAYIKINNNNMNIDIMCDKIWVKVLDIGKEKLIKDLSILKYKVSIEVNKKANDFTLANCREFFDDRSFNKINIKV